MKFLPQRREQHADSGSPTTSLCCAVQDGHSVTARPMQQFYAHDLFKPYVVYDVSHGRDRTASAGSGSRWNLGEINMALALFQELRQYLVSLMQKAAKDGTPRPQPCTVGVITPYRCAVTSSLT